MDYIIEEKLISRFFVASRAERILFELRSKKKRRTCIWRISGDLLKKNYCHAIGSKIASPEFLAQLLFDNGANEKCYVISIDESIDGKYLPLVDVVNKIYGYGPALLFFDNIQMGYLECEHEFGTADRYLLK